MPTVDGEGEHGDSWGGVAATDVVPDDVGAGDMARGGVAASDVGSGDRDGSPAADPGGKAAEALEDLIRRPIARILGHRRLRDDDWWDGVQIRKGGELQEG